VLARLVAGVLALVVVGAAPAPAATAAGTKCVALVVDFTTLGGSVSSSCVTVKTSAAGSDVLQKGHHTVAFDPRYGNDFVCAIDGKPASGCHGNDNTHYWVYYHRAPRSSTWQISQEGAGTYRPANTSTEGWVYDNGSSSAPRPRDVPYSSICTASPSPTPVHSSSTARAASTATPTRQPAATTPATRAPPATRAASPATPPPTRASTAAPAVSAQPQPTLTPTPSVTSVADTSETGFPWRLVVAGLAAFGVGVAAVVRLRKPSG
jgi:hypothetical protein